jgi:hypothetical protein
MIGSVASVSPAVPREIEALASARGVTELVPAVLALTEQLYPSRRITCRVDRDPEEADGEDFFILLDVDVTGLNPDQLTDTQRRWCQEIVRTCPGPSAGAFRLGWVVG